MNKKTLNILLALTFISAGLMSCRMIAKGDSVELSNTQNLKAEADSVLQNPTSDGETKLQADLKNQESYVAKASMNNLIVQEWAKLDDPNGHSLGQLLAKLQLGAVVSKAQLQNRQNLIDQEFDQIIKLEQAKITRLQSTATPMAQ